MLDLFRFHARSKRKRDITDGSALGLTLPASVMPAEPAGDPLRRQQLLREGLTGLEVYRGHAPWLRPGDCPLNLAGIIAAEFARLVTAEWSFSIEGGRRASYIQAQLSPLLPQFRLYTELACAGGCLILKPYPDGHGGIRVSCFLPGDFVPLCDADGKITSARFYDHTCYRGVPYIREETHLMTDSGLVIENRLWQGNCPGEASETLPLSAVPLWRHIQPRVVIEQLYSPLFACFSLPSPGQKDPVSPLGAPIYQRVLPLMREADRQFNRLLWEFEGGELAIDASEDVFVPGRDGKPVLPEGKERLFRPNALDSGADTGAALQVFSPALRDTSLLNGLNRILRFIEDGTGLSPGTLSDPALIARTATEIRAASQRTHVAAADIRRRLSVALRDLISACDALCDLYGLAPAGVCETVIRCGDGILTDTDTERSRDLEEVRVGVLSPEEYRRRWRFSAWDGTDGTSSETERKYTHET